MKVAQAKLEMIKPEEVNLEEYEVGTMAVEKLTCI